MYRVRGMFWGGGVLCYGHRYYINAGVFVYVYSKRDAPSTNPPTNSTKSDN